MRIPKTLRVIAGIIMVISLMGGNIAYAKEVEFKNIDYTKTEDIRIFTENKEIEFDTKPNVVDGRTLVPMRAIFETFGLEVSWNNETKQATGSNSKNRIIFMVDSNKVMINGKEKVIDVPAMIIEKRTMIPLRFLSEKLGYNVVWEGDSNLILISKNDIVQWKYVGSNTEDTNGKELKYYSKYINGKDTLKIAVEEEGIISDESLLTEEEIQELKIDKEVIIPEVNQKQSLFKLYLSPSNQPFNKYAVGNTNEKVQMEALAVVIKNIMDNEYEAETVIGTVFGEGPTGRATEAKELEVDVYVAIHSNASYKVTAKGSVGFYHPFQVKGRELTDNIIDELNKISPAKSSPYYKVEDGMSVFDNYGYAEIRNPANMGLITSLIETDFHTNPETANWIINNKDIIARAYVNGITETFNLNRK